LEIKKAWNRLQKTTKDQLKWVLLRPTEAGGGYDNQQHLLPTLWETEHFVFHYTTGTDGGDASDAPDLTDTNRHDEGEGTFNENNAPDFIEDFASYFEASYTEIVNNRGFNPPSDDSALDNDSSMRNPNGKYDVFVYDLGEGLYGLTIAEQYPSIPSYSFIELNKSYEWALANDDPDGNSKGAMKVTAAHEFFHAIQFIYDVTEEGWWMETTSTYMEDEVYPATNDNYYYLPYWFEFCDLGLQTMNGSHEYGNFIFAKRLSEVFGDEIIREIWQEMVTTTGLTAIDNVLKAKESSLVKEFHDFTQANFFLEDYYTDGADYRVALTETTTYNGVWLEYQYNEANNGLTWIIDSSNVLDDAWMDRWASDYVTISMNGQTTDYTVLFNGLDQNTNYNVSLVTKSGSNIESRDFTLASIGQLDLTYSSTYDSVVVFIRNAGDNVSVNPSWEMALTDPLTVSINASPSSERTPWNFSFSSSISGGIPPYSYSWNFGDNTESSEENPTHRYDTTGTYTPLLSVTDSWGNQKTSNSVTISVTTLATSGDGGDGGGCAMSGPQGDGRDVVLCWVGIFAVGLLLRKKMRRC